MSLLKGLIDGISEFMNDNGRIVGGAVAVGGVIISGALWYIARPKVEAALDEAKEKAEELDDDEDLTEDELVEARKELTKRTIKKVAASVAAPVAVSAVTIGVIIATIISGEKQIAHWSSMAVAGDIAYKELYDKTREVVGEEKANEIRKEVEQDKADNEDIDDLIIEECGGGVLFKDAMTGGYFRSDPRIIDEACIRLNKRMHNKGESYITYNEFFTEIGHSTCAFGEDRGWGGYSYADSIEPNMMNCIRVKNQSAIILDWWVRPMLGYKPDSEMP